MSARSLATQLDETLTHLQQQLLNQRQRIARRMPLALLHGGNVLVQLPALALSRWRQPEPLRIDFELFGILAGRRPECLGELLVEALLAHIGAGLHPTGRGIQASGRLDIHLLRTEARRIRIADVAIDLASKHVAGRGGELLRLRRGGAKGGGNAQNEAYSHGIRAESNLCWVRR